MPRCPECGTDQGGTAPRAAASWWVRTTPWLAMLITAAALVYVSARRAEFSRMTTGGASRATPWTAFLDRPLTVGDLRALEAGATLPGPSLSDRLLEKAPDWMVQPPGRDRLWIQLSDAGGYRWDQRRWGWPMPWLWHMRGASYADVFDAASPPIPDPRPAMGSRWDWRYGALSYRAADPVTGEQRTIALDVGAVCLTILLLAPVWLVAIVVRHRLGPRGRRFLRPWAAVVVAGLLLLGWAITQPDTSSTRWVVPPSFAGLSVGLPAPNRSTLHAVKSRIDAAMLRSGELDDQDLACALLDDVMGRDHDDGICLGAAFRQETRPSSQRSAFGWPVHVLATETVTRTFRSGPRALGQWPPEGPRLDLRRGSLTFIPGHGRTERLQVTTLALPGLATMTVMVLAVGLLTAGLLRGRVWIARWRSAHGRCQACGYILHARGSSRDSGASTPRTATSPWSSEAPDHRHPEEEADSGSPLT